jgi:hypothetical protein
MMDVEIGRKWVAALRSGEYPQTTDVLYDGCGYCCLGVLACVIGLPFERLAAPDCDLPVWAVRDEVGMLPIADLTRVGLSETDAVVLAEMNDQLKPFSSIADFIEANLLPAAAPPEEAPR